jgi:hypothetical protein
MNTRSSLPHARLSSSLPWAALIERYVMDKKLIAAVILSIIGAGIMALILGLSLYTVVFLPAFIIVLVVNIWGEQRAKAVWLGFLLFIFCMSSPLYIYGIDVTILPALTCAISFPLVFSTYYSREDLKQIPPRSLWIMMPLFILMVIVAQIYEWSLDKEIVDSLLYHINYLYKPYLYIYIMFPIIAYLILVVLLTFRNRFAFYLLTPIILITNLLFALENVFKFFFDHLSLSQILGYFKPSYYVFIVKVHPFFVLSICISIVVTLLFMANYKKVTQTN